MDWGRVLLVLAAAFVIGFMGTKLTGAHGDHMGGYHMAGGYPGGRATLHTDGSGGVYHMHNDHVRHCTHKEGDRKTAMSCTDWQ
jgi:hypothetical protein